ncbi:MAG TPA: hypothetical protein PKM27_19190 [Saprospiraceae bacterium]|nr:hypothetical protein [Saprospiraceae bacterium]HNT22552.1 hypothetical protein [Saprospiraceae bacterium]
MKHLFKKAVRRARFLFRFVVYSKARQNFYREQGIRAHQDQLLPSRYPKSLKKLIVFTIPGGHWSKGEFISGGIISIVTFCEETAALFPLHRSATILCTLRNSYLVSNFKNFDNQTDVYRFEQLNAQFPNLTSLLIHIPEYAVKKFRDDLTAGDWKWLKKIPEVHLNVMNQNIRQMPSPGVIGGLSSITRNITVTTAHLKYCNQEQRDKIGMPLHHLSVWISPEQYVFTPWEEKENILVLSPDQHPMKDAILKKLAFLPDLQIMTIHNLRYREYKALISKAKWALTFGEGLDGYFIESIFSGAIGFAVFNHEFFTPDFGALETVYASYDQLEKKLPGDLFSLNQKDVFTRYQQKQFALCSKYYNIQKYRENISLFYSGKYSFP